MLATSSTDDEWSKLNRRGRDDTFTSVRIRHPTDRGLAPTVESLRLPEAERRSRALSANARIFADRVNVYKRIPPTCEPSCKTTTNGEATTSHSSQASETEEPAFKRLTLLQRSLKVSPGTKVASETKKAPPHYYHGHSLKVHTLADSPKSPSSHQSPFTNILELFRNRSSSDGAAKRPTKRSVKDNLQSESPHPVVHKLEPLFIRVVGADTSFYSKSTLDQLSPLDETRSSPVMRKRSNSDNSKFYILRKTSGPGETELLGKVDMNNSKDDAYLQLLKTFTCYHLMPTQTAVIAFDGLLKMKHAFYALVNNGVRAALLWDHLQDSAIGMVTATDLLSGLRYQSYPNGEGALNSSLLLCLKDCDCSPVSSSQFAAMNCNDSNRHNSSGLAHYGCKRKRPCSFVTIDAGADLNSALTVLRLNKIHRLPIVDEETGNILHFLTTKKILHFMYRQMCNSSLPLPVRMYKTLDELLPEGDTGSNLITISNDSSLDEAVHNLLDNCLSSLPVVDVETKLVQNVLNKVDIMNFVAERGWTDFTKSTVREALESRHSCMEKMVACHRKTPLILAVDRLIRENAHRIIVMNSNGGLAGVVSVGNLISFLIA